MKKLILLPIFGLISTQTFGQLTATISSWTADDCSGSCIGEATVSANGGTNPYTYLWSDPSSQTSTTATNLCAGFYSVIVIDALLDTIIANVILPTSNGLSLDSIVSTPVSAPGKADGSMEVFVSGGCPAYTYIWSPNTAESSMIAKGLPEGTYSVTVTDCGGCFVWATYPVCYCGLPTSVINMKSNATVIYSSRNNVTINANQGEVIIFNLQGQRVHKSKLTGNNTISLDKGIYLVRVTLTAGQAGSDGRSFTKKVYLSCN
ncbi:MAG: T9SS type A sorting domain-containing protein [Bacteroidetes bacterium]|nr:T9SS type A sorting domain-containing protein [Bacteroidota bacterium]